MRLRAWPNLVRRYGGTHACARPRSKASDKTGRQRGSRFESAGNRAGTRRSSSCELAAHLEHVVARLLVYSIAAVARLPAEPFCSLNTFVRLGIERVAFGWLVANGGRWCIGRRNSDRRTCWRSNGGSACAQRRT
jgi:hypothetical protein